MANFTINGNRPTASALELRARAEAPDAKNSGAVTDAAAKPAPDAASNTLVMTDAVSRLRQIEEQIARVPSVDNDKVAEIRAAIRDGSYSIDPRMTAEKLLSFV